MLVGAGEARGEHAEVVLAVVIVGEDKTPAALRNASDQFFEWVRPVVVTPSTGAGEVASAKEPGDHKPDAPKVEPPKPLPKRRPRFVVEAVELLAANASDGKVSLSGVGQYVKRTDPSFSPKIYGHSGLLDMLRTYDLLTLQQEPGGHWTVRLRPKADGDDV